LKNNYNLKTEVDSHFSDCVYHLYIWTQTEDGHKLKMAP